MNKKDLVRKNITKVHIPHVFDQLMSEQEIKYDPVQVNIIENGDTVIKAEDVDREERTAAGLTPWDGLAQVNISVDVPSAPSDFNSFEGTVTGSSLAELADFANHCACVGALLSYDESTQIFTIWNGDSNDVDYWPPQGDGADPFDIHPEYGTVIAVCTGKGLWVAKDAVDAENSYTFAPNGTDLYNYFLKTCVTGNGWDNTQHILTNYYTGHEDTYTGTIWKWMKGVESNNSVLANHLFIPNVEELRKVCFNTMDDVYTGQSDVSGDSQSFGYSRNIGVLLGLTNSDFWSSSQYCGNSGSACYVDFGNGDVSRDGKSNECCSLALLHFDDPE